MKFCDLKKETHFPTVGEVFWDVFESFAGSQNSKIDMFQRILGFGIISNFFFAAMINMSMVIGILPIVGLPLPLVSYGGSSMLTYFIGFGLILSIKLGVDRKY